MSDNIIAQLGPLALKFIPFLLALSVHEFAHGWMAKRKGDNTAELMGRLTINPFAHADLVGTFILPIAAIMMGGGGFFGWAKPVPVNERGLKNPKADMFWIALAGPLSNVIMACIGSMLFIAVHIVMPTHELAGSISLMLMSFIAVNLMLAIFNMLPLHPLDGAKVMARFLPERANRFLEENAMTLNIILIAGFALGAFRIIGLPIMHALRYLEYATRYLAG